MMTKKTVCITLVIVSAVIQLCGCNPSVTVNIVEPGITDDVLKTQATRIIQQALASGDPQVRANAIEAAVATNQTQFLPEVKRLLRDEFVPVRFAAAVAIGDIRDKSSRQEIAQLVKDNDENVKIAAGYALYRIGSAGGLSFALKDIKSSDQQVRANAAFLLGKSGDKNALPLLYEAIKDEASDDKVRLNSVEAIARLGDEKIYQKIWAMLISAYADDRVFGIRAMSALGTRQAREAIFTMLKDDVLEVRLIAAGQLGSLGDTGGEKVVEDVLTRGVAEASDQESRDRLNMMGALAIGQIKTPGVKKFLPELLKSESEVVRLAAAKAVFQCSSQR